MEIFDASKSAWREGEKALIARACRQFGACVPPSPFGPGDDCALLGRGAFLQNVFATSDAVIFGRHFDADAPPRRVGEKLVKRNASDIAAMGAAPKFALLCAICSKDVSADWLDEFCRGAGQCAESLGIKIVGGDMASVPERFFSAHMTLLGDSDFPALLREGARAGDKICVTGALGFSRESGRHLDFEPRIAEGGFLARRSCALSRGTEGASACTDISDGVAADLKNLLSPETCALLYSERIPRAEFGGLRASLERALCDGEDYELLFAWRGEFGPLEREWRRNFECEICEIGKIFDASEFARRFGIPDARQCAGEIFVSENGRPPAKFSRGGFSH